MKKVKKTAKIDICPGLRDKRKTPLQGTKPVESRIIIRRPDEVRTFRVYEEDQPQ